MMSVVILFLKIAAVLLFTGVCCENEEQIQVVGEISPEYTFFLKSRPHNDFLKLYKRDTSGNQHAEQKSISEGQNEIPPPHSQLIPQLQPIEKSNNTKGR